MSKKYLIFKLGKDRLLRQFSLERSKKIMKRFLGFLFIVSLVAFAAGSVLALENQPVSVSGKVVLVKPASSQLLGAYRK